MNERIRDLQIQAFAECKTFEDGKIRTDEVFERFAELIVRECAGLVQGVPTDSMGYHTADQKIKEHFGVKE